jgi:hypothetical protein
MYQWPHEAQKNNCLKTNSQKGQPCREALFDFDRKSAPVFAGKKTGIFGYTVASLHVILHILYPL